MYTSFADFYDRLTHDINYTKWADYLQSAFCRFGKDPKLILELGCGTGSLAIELSKRGYDMIALDSSPSMLNQAYQKALKANENILFINQDMRCFELYGTVDAVICCLDSINYITSLQDLNKVFKLVHNYLNPGGLFIFDVNSHYKLSVVLGNNTFYELDEDITWVWANTYNDKDRTTVFDIAFFVRNEDGLYQRYDETHIEKAFTGEEIADALSSSGLTLICELGDLSFDPPASREERIFYIAKKA